MRRVLWLSLAVALALAVACGGGDDGATPGTATPEAPSVCAHNAAAEPPPASNVFANGSFEEGPDPWISLETQAWGTPFAVSDAQAQSGDHSAFLELRSELGGDAKVFGVVQEVQPDAFPQVLSGNYCVTRWEKGTERQYLQFVVIVFDAANRPAELSDAVTNHQIRYILAGVDSQPTFISNARYVMVSTDPPPVGQWVHFERDISQDFQDLWGDVPQGFTNLRILFEVRWDDRQPTDAPSAADVYYDDLYLGPAP